MAGAAAVWTKVLTKGELNSQALGRQIDHDLATLETSKSHLTSFLSSLAEEALQNRTGLGFPFLQQGGLCIALREQYCFYTTHTGVSLVKKRLRQRVQTSSPTQGWFESPFSASSRIITLITGMVGPSAIILLIKLCVPCLLNSASPFIQKRIHEVKLDCDSVCTLVCCGLHICSE